MANFYGESRHQLVLDLETRLRDICDGSSEAARVVVLEGPSGVGKSRVIREFYERRRQIRTNEWPQYWPSLGGSVAAPIRHRKVLGPPLRGFVWESDALPEFLWLTLTFTEGEHSFFESSLPQLTEALESHGIPMLLACAEVDDLDDKLRATLDQARRSVAEMSGDDAGRVVGEAIIEASGVLGAALPGAGYAFSAARATIRSFGERRKRRRDLQGTVDLGPSTESRQQRAQQFAQDLRTLSRPSLPAIIAIEDLHWMDESTAPLLDELSQQPAKGKPQPPVLVIATAWPEAREHTSAYTTWLEQATASARVEVVRLHDLESEALRGIIDEHAPATDERIKDELVSRWSNPYCLELVLTWDEIEDLIEGSGDDRRLIISEEDLSSRPSEIGELYGARWSSLVEPVQKALIAAAGTLPPGDPMQPFEVDVVAHVLAKSDELREWTGLDAGASSDHLDQVIQYLLTARDMSWTMLSGAGESFREPDIARVVMDHHDDQRPRVRRALKAGVITELEQRIQSMTAVTAVLNAHDPDHRLAAQWLLLVAPDGSGPAQMAARFAVAQVKAEDGDFVGALAEVPAAWVAVPDGSTTEQPATEQPLTETARIPMAIARAGWRGEHGEIEAARAESAELSDQSSAVYGPTDPLTLAARAVHAHWTGICERKRQAHDLYVDLSEDIVNSPEASLRLRCSIASGLALWTGEIDRPYDASLRFEEVVTRFTPDLGERDSLILEARRGQARFAGEAGRPDKAVELYRGIADDCARWFGPRSPQNFEARRGLARWLLAAGDTDEALEAYRSVERDCAEALGRDHILTLWASFGLAEAQKQAGDPSGAKATLSHLEQAIQVLDPSHRLHERVAEAQAALTDD